MYHGFTLERLLKNLGALPEEIRRDVKNNAGGVYNHNLYFDSMRPPREENRPEGKLADEIDRAFGSFSAFQKALSDAAKGVFGSGWAWLVCAPEGLKIIQTKDQDTVLPYGVQPLLLIDVWAVSYTHLDVYKRQARHGLRQRDTVHRGAPFGRGACNRR